jgi:hypothetical protein
MITKNILFILLAALLIFVALPMMVMAKGTKNILSVLLAALLMFVAMPMMVMAAEDNAGG